MNRLLALVASLLLAGCGGGGDDQPAPITAFAPAGHLELPNGTAASVTYGLASLAYTNPGTAMQVVRVQAAGSTTLTGQATAATFITYRLGTQPAVTVSLTPPNTVADVPVPAGETIGATVGLTLADAVGAATLAWSDFTLTLQPR